MDENLEVALERIKALGLRELRKYWEKRLGGPPPPWQSGDLLRRTLAYRIQERELGGLDKYTIRRLRALAEALERDGELPSSS